jgi:subtilisin family serine protease
MPVQRGGVWMASERRSPIVGDLRLTAKTSDDVEPVAVVLELNALFPGSLPVLTKAFFDTWTEFRAASAVEPAGSSGPVEPAGAAGPAKAAPAAEPVPATGPPGSIGPSVPAGLEYVTSRMYQVVLTRTELDALMKFDRSPEGRPQTIFKAWPDYKMVAHIDRSVATVKADAALRAFSTTGKGIVWAVIDSGIDATHPHFGKLGLAADAGREGLPAPSAEDQVSVTYGLHRDFTRLVHLGPDAEGDPIPDPTDAPLTDDDGHGTHVAGIISGSCPADLTPHIASGDEPIDSQGFISRTQSAALAGMAHQCELVSLKVLRLTPEGDLITSSSAVLRALDYIRTEVNTVPGMPRIHGVNLSLGCEWDPAHYAAGRSPLCQAIDELVRTGVFVVVSAGNGGQAQADNPNDTVAVMGSISEPAHADKCIAVGSTHRDAPHVFGVTYTSGKGPTLDGRCKPDVVAPGEWITSAATGRLREKSGLGKLQDENPTLTYAPDSGTSMAAPHVSGVLAAFLSVHTEFIGQVDEVKQILCQNATDLGRERYAQGHGLVDLMRMLSQA